MFLCTNLVNISLQEHFRVAATKQLKQLYDYLILGI